MSEQYTFHRMGEPIYGAIAIDTIYGVFTSNVIAAPDDFVQWNNIVVSGTSLSNVWYYVRSGSKATECDWQGPYDSTWNTFNLTGEQLQIRVVLKLTASVMPQVEKLVVSFIAAQNSAVLFTKSFYLGFRPEYFIVTHNATMSENAILRYAVAGSDTIDTSDYQFVKVNELTKLTGMPLHAKSIKLMAELIGDSGVPIVLHEFAFMTSGSTATELNREWYMSSSSSSSESSLSFSSLSLSSLSSLSSNSSWSTEWMSTSSSMSLSSLSLSSLSSSTEWMSSYSTDSSLSSLSSVSESMSSLSSVSESMSSLSSIHFCLSCDQGTCLSCDQGTCQNCDEGQCLNGDQGFCNVCDEGFCEFCDVG